MSYTKPKSRSKTRSNKRGPKSPKTGESRQVPSNKEKIEKIVSGNKFNFINLQNSLNTSTIIQFVAHYADAQPDFTSDIVSADMQRIISKLTIDRGWTTSVTPAIVLNYVEKSYEAFAHFLDIYKSQNMSRLKDSKGRDLTDAFFNYESPNNPKLIGTFVTSPFIFTVPTNANASISNFNWDKDYVSHLSKLYLNNDLIKVAVERYGALHVSDDDSDYMVFHNFHMEVDGIETIPEAWTATLAELDSLMQAHPDLSIILKALRFENKVLTMSENSWQRIRTGDSMAMIVNPGLKTELINLHPAPQIAYPGYTGVLADLNRYVDFNGPYSVYGYPDSAEMGTDPFIQRAISNGIKPKGLILTYLRADGSIADARYPLMANVAAQMVTVPTAIPTMPALGQFMVNWDKAVAVNVAAATVPLIRRTTYGFDWNTTTTVIGTGTVSHDLLPNDGNIYQLDDIDYILSITRATLLYGVDYKKELFALYESIAEPNNIR